MEVVPLARGSALAVHMRGEGPPVVLVHGIPGSSGVWGPVATRLAERGHRVLVPDLLGFGASARPTGAEEIWLDAQAGALRTALSALAAGPAIVVAHDYGVPVAVLLAAREPALVSALVLAAGNVLSDTPVPPPLNALRLPLVGPVAQRVLLSPPALRLMLRLGNATPGTALPRDVYLGDAAQQRAIASLFTTALGDLRGRYAPVEAALATLPHPVAVLWGDRDPFFPVEQGRRTAARIGNGRLQVLSGAGHFLPAERPDAFVEAVTALRAGAWQEPR